ncbi:MAG TPA: hypothetical protein VGL27_09380 [Negativicutes bacterium]
MDIKVRWFDGYLEEFQAVEARSGAYILWIRLEDGQERWIPLSQVRWFSGFNKGGNTNEMSMGNR